MNLLQQPQEDLHTEHVLYVGYGGVLTVKREKGKELLEEVLLQSSGID